MVGSANLDLVVRVGRHPRPGETLLGREHSHHHGGKGANQAVAAARAGAATTFVGRVGDDAAGRELLAGLESEGVDVSYVEVDPAVPSGLAVVVVDSAGENAIVVSPGANAMLAPEDLPHDLLGAARVTLLQLEIPLATVVAAARAAEGIVVLDPTPVPDRGLPPGLLEVVDLVVPNERELVALVGSSEPEAAEGLGVETVVVTRGERGAALVRGGEVVLVSAPEADVVDTTGAGDAFRGTLAAVLARGGDLGTAVRAAVVAGTAAVTRLGAR